MNKTFINILKSSLLWIFLIGLISCSNIISDNNSSPKASNGKTTLKINLQETEIMRTLYPGSSVSILNNFVIKGKKTGSNSEPEQLATADTITDLNAVIIEFNDADIGSWDFTLTGEKQIGGTSVTFSDTKTVTIQKNKLNAVSFKLKTQDITVGGLNITVTFSGSANKVIAKLQDESKTTDIDSKTYESSDFTTNGDEHSITFTRDIENSSEALSSGTYYLLFSFYDTTLSTETALNTLPNYVRIINGLTTTANPSISLNEVYTITYEDNGGTLLGGIKTEKYSRKSTVSLPIMEKEGFIFAGWYESSDFSGDPVTEIKKGSSGNKTFYARFISSTLYVSQTGNNENNGLTESTALATITKAVEQIISYGNIAADYTIKISGTIPGGQIISSSLTTAMATSLTLEGVTGKTGDTWVDVLDGGFTSSSKGTTLSINTAVPITLKNLKITGGYQGGGSGAGIKLAGDSTLVMESGEISGNTGNDSGQASAAGVYISHGGTANFGATQIAGAKFTMNGGSICNNTGTGVTMYDGSNPGEFNMYGGTITGNSGYGVDLVYSTGPFGKFTMKGSAVVTSDNKVFIGFPNGTKIYIADELTGTAPVATIKLNGYNENTEVIALANGVTDTSLLSAACAKIEVAPYNGTPWYLTSDGKLTSTNPNAGNSGGDPSSWTGSADGHDYVDLGLPSGTLWATMNVGATVENRYYGDYFAWGETEPRYTSYTISRTDDGYGGISENISVSWKSGYEDNGYSWDNYFDGTNGENFTIFKDADSSELDATHDAATVNWGSNWKTPTKDQCSELINSCFMTSTNDYNNTGIAGIIVYKATAGDEGKDTFGSTPPELAGTYSLSTPHIFFPLCGRFPQNNYVSSNDLCAYLWSRTLEPSYPETAYQFSPFNTESYDPVEFDPRANGEPIRPVYVGSTGGNSGNTNSIPDDFVLVTGSKIDFNIGYGVFRSCEDYPITIRNLYVCNHEVTQKEYEQYCIYGTDKDEEGNLGTQFAPTSSHGTGDNFPVYFVSWHDAIVYCNLRSLDEGLTPVYSLPKPKTDPNDPDEALVYSTKPSEWVDIVTSGDKYCGPNLNYYYDISSNYWSNWEWISASPGYESVRIDENANGYRLPTTEEWEYFARGGQGLKGAEAAYEHSGAIDDDAIDNVAHHAQYPYGSFNEDSTTFECGKDVNPNSLGLYDLCGNVKEWCFDLVDDDGQRWIIDGVEFDRNAMYTCDRKATIGFRVVRNAQ